VRKVVYIWATEMTDDTTCSCGAHSCSVNLYEKALIKLNINKLKCAGLGVMRSLRRDGLQP